jgi:hypothetical protein
LTAVIQRTLLLHGFVARPTSAPFAILMASQNEASLAQSSTTAKARQSLWLLL